MDPAGIRSGAGKALFLALLAIGAGVAIRLTFDPLLGQRSTFIVFVPAVVIAAALAGLVPGLVAALIGAAAGLACDSISGELVAGNWAGAVAFVLVGAAVSIGGEWFQRARGEAHRINRDLARREAHLRSILETVPDAMVVIDEDGLIRDFSNTASYGADPDGNVRFAPEYWDRAPK